MNELAAQAHAPPTWIEMSAMGKLVHDFYSGIESIFSRIAVQFDGGVPTTSRWHSDLLHQMSAAREGKRPAVIDDTLWARLDDCRDFRHFFRSAYRAELEWDRLQPHVARMSETLAMLQTQLEQFFAAVHPKEEPP